MTDNEKRAHDFAIAIAMDLCHLKTNAQMNDGKAEISIDYFKEYMNAYETLIELFNDEFPNGK